MPQARQGRGAPRKIQDMHQNNVIIIGGGLIGTATLYELASRNVSAILIEAREEIAMETSFANGGMISPSAADPWNSPGVGRHLLASLFDPASGMKLHAHMMPQLVPWGLKFLRHSLPEAHRRSTLANYALAAYSAARIESLRTELGLKFEDAPSGTMKIFATEKAMKGPLQLARELESFGLEFERLDAAGAIEAEPQLHRTQDKIGGALYFPSDGTGDARKFALALTERTRAMGVEIRTSTRAQQLLLEEGEIKGVVLDTGEKLSGSVVLAAGIEASDLARHVGLQLPIKPAKGYSVTFGAAPLGNEAPRLPIIDDAMHTAIVPIGDRLRVVGMAEFAGRDKRLDPARLNALNSVLERIYPHLVDRLDLSSGVPWTGLRPMSADGRPFIGPSPIPGLWLNCGHGHLGFTKAAGSAHLLVDQMLGQTPEIDPTPYSYQDR